jgi:hypothetical protein
VITNILKGIICNQKEYGKPDSIISALDSLKSLRRGLKTSRIVNGFLLGLHPIDFRAATMDLAGRV